MLSSRAGVFAGIGYMVLATAFFGVLDTAAKYVAISVAVLMAISVRYLVQAILCTVGFCAGLGLLGLPLTWTDVASPWLWAMMVLTGVAGAVGHFVLTLAYQRAPVSTLMPYMYCQIGFATLGGWWAFGHAPDRWAWIGMALIAICGLCSAWLTAHDRRAAALLPET